MAEIKSFPNNSDEYIGAEEVMHWLHGRTSGVYGANGNAAVSAVANAMQVQVAPGIGWIVDAADNGICWWFDNAITLDIDSAEATGTLNRIDRVVVEWLTTDYADLPTIKILKGTDASTAAPPSLTNNSTVRQLSLARISIPAGTTELSPLNIIDERMDETVCGIVTETVTADTSMISAQYEEALQDLLDAISQAWQGEISDESITTAKLADGAVTDGKLSSALQATLSNLDTGKAPTNHASSATTYGKGTTSDYGHLKISDNYTSSAGTASDGVAASSKAVYDTYNKFKNNILYYTGVTCSATTGNFVNYSQTAITANHVLLDVQFARPDYITSDFTWTTAAGNIKLNGTCKTATTCYLVLGLKQN